MIVRLLVKNLWQIKGQKKHTAQETRKRDVAGCDLIDGMLFLWPAKETDLTTDKPLNTCKPETKSYHHVD